MNTPNSEYRATLQPSPHLANPMQPSTVSRLRPKIWRIKSILRGKLKALPQSVDHSQVGKTEHFTAWRHPGHWIVPKRAQYEAWFTQELAARLRYPQSELQTCFCVSVIGEAEMMLPKHDLDKRPASEAYFEWVLRKIFSKIVADQIVESILEKSQSHGVTPAYCMYVHEYPISMWISQIAEFLIQDSGLCDIMDPMNAEPDSVESNTPGSGFVHSRADFLPGVEHLSNPIVMSMRYDQTDKDTPIRPLKLPIPPERSPLRVINTPSVAPAAAPTEQDVSSVHPALRRSLSANAAPRSRNRPFSAPTEQDISAMRAGSRTPVSLQTSTLPTAAVAPVAAPTELDINIVHPALRTAASPTTSTLPAKTAAGIALPPAPSWLNAPTQPSPARVPTPIPNPATPATGLDPTRPVEPAILPARQPVYSGIPATSSQTLIAQHDATQALRPPTASSERQDKGKQPMRTTLHEIPSQATTHVQTEDDVIVELFRRKPAKDASKHDLMTQIAWLETAIQHVRTKRERRKDAGHTVPDEKPMPNPSLMDQMSRFRKWFADRTRPDEPQHGRIMGQRELTQQDLRLRRVAKRHIKMLMGKLEELERLDREDEIITGQPESSSRAKQAENKSRSWAQDDDGAVGPSRDSVPRTARQPIESDDDDVAVVSTWSDSSGVVPVVPESPAPPVRTRPVHESFSFRDNMRSLQRRCGLMKGHGRARRVIELEPHRLPRRR